MSDYDRTFSRTKTEMMTFTDAGVGLCRDCGRPLGIKLDPRNFSFCYFPDELRVLEADSIERLPNYQKIAIIVNKTAFRCPFCTTRHQFVPNQFPKRT